LNGTIPKGYTEPITVKFANNPSNNKAFPPLAAYLTPQTAAAARRFAGPIHPTTAGRFRLVSLSPCASFLCNLPCKDVRFVWCASF
jgi:ELAV like protein 2/3/4